MIVLQAEYIPSDSCLRATGLMEEVAEFEFLAEMREEKENKLRNAAAQSQPAFLSSDDGSNDEESLLSSLSPRNSRKKAAL